MSGPRIDEQLRLRIAEQLAGHFKGDIIGPDHAEYDEARMVWNAMIDRRPGLILRCFDTRDVVAAVSVARDHGLPPSVRCGGHNVAGKAMSDGGLTIDLSGLREVTVDPERKLVHVGGGCLLGDVDAATAPRQRAGGGIRLAYSNPMYLDDVAVDFPDMPIILAHPSFPWEEEALAVATHKPQVYIDLSGWSPKYFPPILVQYANTLLKDKVLFGTDFPMLTPERWRDDLERTAIRNEVKPGLYKHNAARLLGL